MSQFNYTKTKAVDLFLSSLICIFVLSSSSIAGLRRVGDVYSPVSSLPGDQTSSSLAFNGETGFIAWEDNSINPEGNVILGSRIHGGGNLNEEVFLISSNDGKHCRSPKVIMNKGGNPLFVWESEGNGFIRIMQPNGAFSGNPKRLGSETGGGQTNIDATIIEDGSIVVVWEERTGVHGTDIFAQIFASEGSPKTDAILINEGVLFNQKDPSIISEENGGFLVVWATENVLNNAQTQFANQLSGRRFDRDGIAAGPEQILTKADVLASNPSIAKGTDGKCAVAFSSCPNPLFKREEDPVWSVHVIGFNTLPGDALSSVQISDIGSNDQAKPTIKALPNGYVVVWTGVGGKGDQTDVYGVKIENDLTREDPAIIINKETGGLQYMPAITVGEDGEPIIAWSEFVGGQSSFDIVAQRFSPTNKYSEPVISGLNSPYLAAVSGTEANVSWDPVELASGYQVEVNGQWMTDVIMTPYAVIDGLLPAEIHNFRYRVVHASGNVSMPSDSAEIRTWARDENQDGLPDDYQTLYWGKNPSKWRDFSEDSDGDGATNGEELLAGTNPMNSEDVLSIQIGKTQSGVFNVNWETLPGAIYQIQATTDLENWEVVFGPALAEGFEDSINIEKSQSKEIYRLIRLQ